MLSKMTKALIDEDFPHVSGIHRYLYEKRVAVIILNPNAPFEKTMYMTS